MITDQVHDKRDGQIRIPCRLPVEITPLYTAALFQYVAAHVTKEKIILLVIRCFPGWNRLFRQKQKTMTGL